MKKSRQRIDRLIVAPNYERLLWRTGWSELNNRNGRTAADQLFVKPTEAGRAHAEPVSDALPYPGAKPHLLIEADRWAEDEWLGRLLRFTSAELPAPKPRKSKRST